MPVGSRSEVRQLPLEWDLPCAIIWYEPLELGNEWSRRGQGQRVIGGVYRQIAQLHANGYKLHRAHIVDDSDIPIDGLTYTEIR